MGTIGLARLHFAKVKKVSRLLSPRPRVLRPSTFLELRAQRAKVQTACGSKLVLVCLALLVSARREGRRTPQATQMTTFIIRKATRACAGDEGHIGKKDGNPRLMRRKRMGGSGPWARRTECRSSRRFGGRSSTASSTAHRRLWPDADCTQSSKRLFGRNLRVGVTELAAAVRSGFLG